MNSDKPLLPDTKMILARISGVFGVKGWVKVYSYTEPRDGLLKYKNCLLVRDGKAEPANIAEGQRHGKTVILRFSGVNDREAAEDLIGSELAIDRADLPEPGAGSYYWVDLEGLKVRHVDGVVLGTVDHLLSTGANDVLVVKDGTTELLIPFIIDSVVRKVDLDAGIIDVDWEWS